MGRCGSSRTLGPAKQCAVWIRARWKCVWCLVRLVPGVNATIDHLDGDAYNHAPSNVAGACRGCNSARRWEWPSGIGWSEAQALLFHDLDSGRFSAYLRAKGKRLSFAIARAARETSRPLNLVAGKRLAKRLHALRYQRLAEHHRRARERQASADQDERAAIQKDWSGPVAKEWACRVGGFPP